MRCKALLCSWIFFLGLAAGGSCDLAWGLDAEKEFKDQRFGYTVRYPSDWFLDSSVGTFSVETFPPQRSVRGVGLPPNGAGITLVPSEALNYVSNPKTIREWVDIEVRHKVVTGTREILVSAPDGNVPVVEVRSRCCAVAPFEDGVSWYFQVGARMFRASLGYWEGDTRADDLVRTLREVVLSVRLTHQGG